MNIRFAISMFALTAAVSLVLILNRQNTIASGDDSKMSLLSFNRSAADTAQLIMEAWRHDPKKTADVKKIVRTDYILMALYSLYLCTSIYHRRKIEKRQFLRNWL